MEYGDMTNRLTREIAGDGVYRSIREAIERGELAAGQSIASTRSLKDSFGVSLHAVLTALGRLEREGWILRKRGSGTFVCDLGAKGLPRAKGREVGIVTCISSTFVATFLAPLIEAIKDEAEMRGAQVVDRYYDTDEKLFSDTHREDAIIWLCPDPPNTLSLPPKRPLVFISQAFEGIMTDSKGFDLITADSRQGGAIAGEFFKQSGCKEVVYVGVKEENAAELTILSKLRLDGFIAGWGRPLQPGSIVTVPMYASRWGIQIAADLFRNRKRPLGIFAASDDLAMGIVHGAIAHGVELGKDVKLVGFDGQPPRFPGDPMLTTVGIPLQEMGRVAARMAIERTDNPEGPMRRVSLGCELRPGGTG